MSEPKSPRNPNTEADRLLLLIGALSGEDPAEGIYRQEKQGQRQMVESDVIPTDIGRNGEEELTALGFTLGDPVPGDEIFRYATLPKGWTRKATDHDMWSTIVDEAGIERVEIFYKAAFYDRHAFLRLKRADEAAE